VADSYHAEDKDFPGDPPEAYLAGELFIGYRVGETAQIIEYNESNQSVEQAVKPANEIPEPASEGGDADLCYCPNLFHKKNHPFDIKIVNNKTAARASAAVYYSVYVKEPRGSEFEFIL